MYAPGVGRSSHRTTPASDRTSRIATESASREAEVCRATLVDPIGATSRVDPVEVAADRRDRRDHPDQGVGVGQSPPEARAIVQGERDPEQEHAHARRDGHPTGRPDDAGPVRRDQLVDPEVPAERVLRDRGERQERGRASEGSRGPPAPRRGSKPHDDRTREQDERDGRVRLHRGQGRQRLGERPQIRRPGDDHRGAGDEHDPGQNPGVAQRSRTLGRGQARRGAGADVGRPGCVHRAHCRHSTGRAAGLTDRGPHPAVPCRRAARDVRAGGPRRR